VAALGLGGALGGSTVLAPAGPVARGDPRGRRERAER